MRVHWRQAMNGAAAVAAPPTSTWTRSGTPSVPFGARLGRWVAANVGFRHVVVFAAVLAYPAVATPFFTYQIGAQSLTLGLIALSLTFLAGCVNTTGQVTLTSPVRWPSN